jgi:HlyD family secretion protein
VSRRPIPGRRGRRGRRWWWLGGLTLVLVVAGWLLSARAGELGDELEWATAERGDLVLGVDVTGELEAIDPAIITSPNVRRMRDIRIAFLAPEGAPVRTGQPVVGFDTTELQRQLQERVADRDSADREIEKRRTDQEKRRSEMEMQLAEARARLRKSELELEVPEDLVAAKELEVQRIDRNLAEGEIAYLDDRIELLELQMRAEIGALVERRSRAAARVREIEDQIARMQVTAPRDGIVIYETSWQGDKPKVGDSVWRGNPVLQIPDLDRLRAGGSVDEADIGDLAVGQPVVLRLDARPDQEIPGRVARIGRTVQARSPVDPVKVVTLEVELDDTDPSFMRPGMRFRGRIETGRSEDTVLVPAAAVTATADGPRIYRRGAFGYDVVEPELGRRTPESVEVLSGLAAGDRVALGMPPAEAERRELRAGSSEAAP